MTMLLGDEIVPLVSDAHPPDPAAEPYGQHTVIPEIQGHRDLGVVRNVTRAALTVHRPDPTRATGTAVIVCPGGSFVVLTDTGTRIARKLATQGITAFVLRYRLLPTPADDAEFLRDWGAVDLGRIEAHSRVATADAGLAIRTVRARSADWSVDPNRVGIMGFSAGAMLTVEAATGYDTTSRPDFAAALYPPVWHEYRIPPDAPPLFLAFAADDEGDGVVEGCTALQRNWLRAGRPMEAHVYERGGHGFAEQDRGLPCDGWLDRYSEWMRMHGI
ncbi:alpha/beta hydrolase [Nocardia sp. NPDC001965]